MAFDTVPLVLIRHGSSEWNQSGRFTGWTDIDLGEQGYIQAETAGHALVQAGIRFDEVHTSILRRTGQTADRLLAAMQHAPIPRHVTWRLNERHYGQLQGKDKGEIFAEWGEQNYRRWWRGYHEPPPALDMDDSRHPRFQPLFANIPPELLPRSESLKDCQQRLLPWWQDQALPALKQGKHLLVVSHGNTLRSLVMHLDRIAPADVEKVEIPSGKPLVYHLNEQGAVTGREWLPG